MATASLEPLADYRAALVEMDGLRLADDRRGKRWNRCVHRVQRAQLQLRQTAEGQAAIAALIDDPVPTVAHWAASHALFWDEDRARTHLERVAASNETGSFDARMTLQEFDAGRLRHDWQPPKHG
ncbi:hypothetical protein ACFX43_09935 [Nocardioides sp. YIM B13467]|uniref:hypothetical protein n=1 Tax=Nocardioides sp. YIM B13467 TaxID=3366294 RepID=UPI003672944F